MRSEISGIHVTIFLGLVTLIAVSLSVLPTAVAAAEVWRCANGVYRDAPGSDPTCTKMEAATKCLEGGRLIRPSRDAGEVSDLRCKTSARDPFANRFAANAEHETPSHATSIDSAPGNGIDVPRRPSKADPSAFGRNLVAQDSSGVGGMARAAGLKGETDASKKRALQAVKSGRP